MLSVSLNWPPVGVPGPAVYGLPSPPATCAGIDQWSCNWYTPKALAVPIKLTNKWRSPMFSHTLSDNLLKIPLRWPFWSSLVWARLGLHSQGCGQAAIHHWNLGLLINLRLTKLRCLPGVMRIRHHHWDGFKGGSDGNPWNSIHIQPVPVNGKSTSSCG